MKKFYIIFSLLFVIGGFLGINTALADDGAARITLGTPSVTAGTMTVSGDVLSGTRACGLGGGGQQGICFCCTPNDHDTGNWKTCEVNSISYTLTGPLSKSGSVPISSTTQSPNGCSNVCGPANDDIPICRETKAFSLNETSLPAGTYTLLITASDCAGTNSLSKSFTVSPQLAGTCSATPSTSAPGQAVTWRANISGGNGSYVYRWSGTDNLSGTSQTASKTYTTPGTKTSTVVVTSAGYSLTKSCSMTVNSNLTASCSGTPNPVTAGNPVTWSASATGGNGTYAYSWSGTASLTGNTQSVSKTYSTVGTKNASITVTSGTESASSNCSVDVQAGAQTQTNGTINVTSNIPTTWTISGPQGHSQTSASTGTSYSNTLIGTYTITPATLSGYNAPTVTPSSSQTLNADGTITFAINYTAVPPPPPDEEGTVALRCSPTNQNVQAGQTATLTTYGGGSGSVSWNAPGGNPSTGGDVSAFSTVFNSAGVKGVQVFRGGTSSTCTVTVSAPTVINTPARGSHGANYPSSCRVVGWANDADSSDTDLTVKIYSDGSLVKTGVANVYRSDLVGVCPGGTCSFNESLSGILTDGLSHNIRVTTIDAQTGAEIDLNNTPKTIACPVITSGTIVVRSNVPTTWSLTGLTPQTRTVPATETTYSAQEAGTYTLTVPNVSGYNSPIITPSTSQTLSAGATITYDINYTSDGDGSGTLSCYPASQSLTPNQTAVFSVSGGRGTISWSAPEGNPSTGGDSSSFSTRFASKGLKIITVSRGGSTATCATSVSDPGNDLPNGSHDGNNAVSCSVSGWATDPDNRSNDVMIQIYSDGTNIKSAIANLYRKTEENVCDKGTCGFDESIRGLVSASTLHTITVKAVDLQTGDEVELSGSPKTINCPAGSADFILIGNGVMEAQSSAAQSESTTATVKVVPSGGWGNTVTLTAIGLDSNLAGTVFTLADNSLTSGEYGTGSTIRATIPANLPNGNYGVRITGVSNGVTRTADVLLRVTSKKPAVFEEF